MADTRLFIDSRLEEGAKLRLNEGQSHKLATTLRLGIGAPVRVFNSRDGEWRAEIDAKDRYGVALRVRHQLRAPRAVPDLDLLFAPVKRHATDLIVEKATELGVRRIRPVLTHRTIAETVRLDRLNAIAREAAEQTERFDTPEILEPLQLAKALDSWNPSRPLIYADEAGDDDRAPWGGERGRARPIFEAMQQLTPSARGEDAGERHGANERSAPPSPVDPASSLTPPPGSLPSRVGGVGLLIGPEGGFTPEERRMLRSLTYVIPVSLGPRILRAETAVIAALTVLQATVGDWRVA
jgi:16S rRNA (uracil1498-N3)-methyltransferase